MHATSKPSSRRLAGLGALGLALALGSFAAVARAGGDVSPVSEPERLLSQGNTRFGLKLFGQIARTPRGKGNVFFSPLSVSIALDMTRTGARGETEKDMARTLEINAIDPTKVDEGARDLLARLDGKGDGWQVAIANSLWGQKGTAFAPAFTKVAETSYRAALGVVDFVGDADGAAKTINDWVSKETRERIKDLVKASMVKGATLVLTNAVYFKAEWVTHFEKSRTTDLPFYAASGEVKAPTMEALKTFEVAAVDDVQALALPYKGGALEMMILLPKAKDGLAALEAKLTPENLRAWRSAMKPDRVRVLLPRWKTTWEDSLQPPLKAMGMSRAFEPSQADFSGMIGDKAPLFIGDVIHKAFVDVNEDGTEAAAATAVIVDARGRGAPGRAGPVPGRPPVRVPDPRRAFGDDPVPRPRRRSDARRLSHGGRGRGRRLA